MPSSSSLDKRFSDIVGGFNYKKDKNFEFEYNYALDENIKISYNEVSADYSLNNFKFNLSYLEENKLSGDKDI